MTFDIFNKVAIITGGARGGGLASVKELLKKVTGGAGGIGLACAKELLKNNAKGVTIADIDEVNGNKSVEELNGLFGNGKAIFVHVDTSDKEQFENVFKVSLNQFKHVDILVNNAGIINEVDWKRCFDVNINGYVNGIVLGMENYLRSHKSSDEAVILNTCSIAAFDIVPYIPIYSISKFAIMGMTKTWGHEAHFERTKVRVLALCPGLTDTNISKHDAARRFLAKDYIVMMKDTMNYQMQSADRVGHEIVNLIKNGKCGSLNITENNLPTYEYVLPDKDTVARNM